MSKRYHMLFTRDDRNGWTPQFGDYDRNTVVVEVGDSYRDFPKDDIVIIPLPNARQSHCDNAVRVLNKYGKHVRFV